MNHAFTLAAAAVLLAAAACSAHGPGFFCDPVVTHTNGMRLASTDAYRSHHVYWRCDPGHLGYCGGQTYDPLHNDARGLGTREWGHYAPPCTPLGPTGGQTGHSMDGLEAHSGESLGAISASILPASGPEPHPAALRPVPSPVAPAVPADTGASAPWLDAIHNLGRKMMTTPDR